MTAARATRSAKRSPLTRLDQQRLLRDLGSRDDHVRDRARVRYLEHEHELLDAVRTDAALIGHRPDSLQQGEGVAAQIITIADSDPDVVCEALTYLDVFEAAVRRQRQDLAQRIAARKAERHQRTDTPCES